MTNVEGLVWLFVALGLFGACLAVAILLGGWLAWLRWRPASRPLSGRVGTALALGGILLSLVSWGYAIVFITPGGILTHLSEANPVLVVLLVGYSLPAILAGFALRGVPASHEGTQVS